MAQTEEERKAKRAAYAREWRARNPERVLAAVARWKEKNPAAHKRLAAKANAAYRERNPGKNTESSVRSRRRNPEHYNAYQREYAAEVRRVRRVLKRADEKRRES